MRDILANVPLFADLNSDELKAVASLVTVTKVPKKSIVVQEGENGDAMFIILQGGVKISYYAQDGRELVLSMMESGSFFGEMSLIDEQPRSATVMTMEESDLAVIRRADFERLMQQHPSITRKLLAEVVQRLRRTSLVLERISTMDVPHRLYAFLHDYCRRSGRRDAEGNVVVKLPTHQLLADQLSTSRETISRAVSTMKKEGIITSLQQRGQVRVDMHALSILVQALH